jgi:CheY-like chemotaxis protein
MNIVERDLFKNAGILIVEDDVGVAEILSLICKHAGFRHVINAQDGIEGMRQLQRHTQDIDLISLDLVMPRMGGIELAQAVVNTHEHIVGLVVVTGVSTENFEKSLNGMGSETVLMRGVVQKPFDAPGLLHIFEEALRDVYAKRQKQVERGVSGSLSDLKRMLANQTADLAEMRDRLSTVSTQLTTLRSEVKESLASKPEPKTGSDFGYVWALTFLFLIVSGALFWASQYIQLLALLGITSFAVVVLMLVAVFDLSKGGKLSEKSLMEVLRKAFQFISRNNKPKKSS